MFKPISEFLKFLVLDKEGKVSHTKFWSNVSYAVVTWAFIFTVLHDKASVDLWLVYLGVVSGHTVLSKWLSGKASLGHAQIDQTGQIDPNK